MRQKLKLLVLVFSLAMGFLSMGMALAAKDCAGGVDPADSTKCLPVSSTNCDSGKVSADPTKCTKVDKGLCASGKVSADSTKCLPLGSCTGEQNCLTDNPIYKYLNLIINFLAGLVALAVIGNIIVGGIQYSSAGGAPDKVSAARKRVANAVMAFFFFLLTYGFLQWLIPGGVFK